MKLLNIKFKIAALIALLLLVGMLLLDMVMVFGVQQLLLKSEREKGGILIDLIGTRILAGEESGGDRLATVENGSVREMAAASNLVAALWMDAGGELQWIQGRGESSADALGRVSRVARNRQTLQADMVGTTWGIFWRQKRYLVLAGPVHESNRIAGVVGISIQLDSIFSRLRNVQKFIGYYLIINILLLSLLGLYRLHQMMLRPVQKIIGRAEAFRPGDTAFILEESGENEFARLSSAINRVFDLNREDQEKLRQTVNRLEKAMARLKQAQREVIRAEKLATVGRLSSGVAHEIGNPIGIVMGYLELIKRGARGNEEILDYIQRAEDEVQRIRAVIRQLLDYSRPSEVNRESFSLHRLLDDAVEMARIQPLFADLKVAAELRAGYDTVTGDPGQLKQLFLNLILNAADAIKLSGKDVRGAIRVVSENVIIEDPGGRGGRHMLRVHFEDNGSGIPEGDLSRIFDPFFSTKPTGMGSGLGLWVSLQIAESMGGTIEAGGNEGEGARMTLMLPVESNTEKART